MRVGGVDITRRVAVVAEIGNNHEGDPHAARALVRAAAAAGCDAVKVQAFRAADFVRPRDADRLAQLTRFELPRAVFAELGELARDLGMAYVATPLDLGTLEYLAPRVDALKVASGDNDVPALLDAAAATDRPVVVSAGMLDAAGVRAAVDRVRAPRRAAGRPDDVCVLHCVTAYPAPHDAANLAAIGALARDLGCPVGWSDHDLGEDVAVLAVAAGARVVEKHLTLDRSREGFRDHALSADPPMMARIVERIRFAEEALGDPAKRPQPCEEPFLVAARRSVVAARDLPAGHTVTAGDLTWMRPRDGLAPGEEGRVVGRVLARPVARGESVTGADVA